MSEACIHKSILTIKLILRYLDFINVMTYDLHGDWDSVTGENAPLYPGDYDNEQYETTLNVVSKELLNKTV